MEIPHYKRLKDQPAIITGANSGIGKAIALQFAREGAKVAINYIANKESADEMVKQIEENGGEAIAIRADVSKEDEVKDMFSKVIDHFGTLHILVNNAGIQKDAPFHKMSLSDWQKVIGVNLTGQFLCAREAVNEFLKRGPDDKISVSVGKIICISSVHEVIPWASHANYAASKGGIKLLMETMAQELAPKKIRVNSLGPGAIKTPINKSVWSDPVKNGELMKLIPDNRIGDPEDVARAAVWLASDESEYVNGITLFVDGGMTLYPGFATGG